MKRTRNATGAVATLGLILMTGLGSARAEEKKMQSLYEMKVNTLEGQPFDFATLKGKVTLVVNTASECGYTPQYAGLEQLHEALAPKGFSVVGFPSNDFGGQEPGDAKQIRLFCSTKYSVKFPLVEKVKTKGEGQHAVYRFLSATHGEPKWNFHKYLVGKDGKVIAAFPSKVAPDSAELRDAIEKALKN